MTRRRLFIAALLAALVIPASAGAWGQYYAVTQVFNPGGVETSGSNYSLNYNYTAFDPRGCCDYMRLNLCSSSGCYDYLWCTNDCDDPRTISYGYAKCSAYLYNGQPIDVNSCYVRNIYG